MYCGLFMGRNCCRFSTSTLKLLHNFSRLGVQLSRDRVNVPSKHFLLSGVTSRRAYTTQEDRNLLNKEQNTCVKTPEEIPLQPSQDLTNESTNNYSNFALPEPSEGDEDTSDPCAELDFYNMTNESKSSNEFAEESSEDERFPLPSEPLDKG